MLTNVFTKAVRDRWMGMTIAATVVGLFLVYGIAVYREIDLSIYTDLPPAIRDLFGFSDTTDASGLAFGAIYSFFGALTLSGVAISIGASAFAGEERDGTIGLLLANPRSRTQVLASKASAMVALILVGAAILWGAGLSVPALLDADVSGIHLGALVLHLLANALFYGFLALLVGAWTGNGTTAAGLASAVMIVSYLAVGTLPLLEGWEDLARAFPWYYYDSSRPVANGVQWRHLGVLFGSVVVFAAAAVVGVNRRDLRERSVGDSLLDRLRRNPLTDRLMERLAGSTRVSRIWVKTTSEHQGLLIVTGSIVLIMGVVMGPFFTLLDADLTELTDQLPEALLAMVGSADMSTPEGFYQAENFSLVLPITLMTVTIIVGARALAGEEHDRTMGLLLSNPLSRRRVVLEKALAMVMLAAALGSMTFAGTVLGSLLGGLGMDTGNIAATSLLLTLLALAFGAASLAISAATGRTRAASYGSAGLAFGLYLVNAFVPLDENLSAVARWSPFHYYLSSDPLVNGMRWSHAAVLAGLAALLVALSTVFFDRRDLRG